MSREVISSSNRRASWRRAAGMLLVFCTMGFLLYRSLQQRQLLGEALSTFSAIGVLMAAILYFVAAVLISFTWPLVLRGISRPDLPMLPLACAHMRAQVAKYLPGGVLHFAARHSSGRDASLSHQDLVIAAGIESMMLLGVASMMSLGIAGDSRISQLAPWLPGVVWLMPLAIPAAMLAAWLWLRGHQQGFRLANALSPMISVVVLNAAFFSLGGLALMTLTSSLPALSASGWIGWLSLAWICGYVVPGAPGGIGIRETVLVLALGPTIGQAESLALAFAYRLVTMFADGLAAAVAWYMGRSFLQSNSIQR